MTALAYVDASALAKLILDEANSVEMRRWYVETERVAMSRVGVVETMRAVGRQPHDQVHLELVLRSIETVELDRSIARAAGAVGPATLRTLDAIHLATALALVRGSRRLRHLRRPARRGGAGGGRPARGAQLPAWRDRPSRRDGRLELLDADRGRLELGGAGLRVGRVDRQDVRRDVVLEVQGHERQAGPQRRVDADRRPRSTRGAR